MTATPGMQGSVFNEIFIEKIKSVGHMYGYTNIQLDGGITAGEIKRINSEFGIDSFVVGSAILKSEDLAQAKSNLDKLLNVTL